MGARLSPGFLLFFIISNPRLSGFLGVESFEAFSYSVMRLRDPERGVRGGLSPWKVDETARRSGCSVPCSLISGNKLIPPCPEESDKGEAGVLTSACPCWVVGLPSSGGGRVVSMC